MGRPLDPNGNVGTREMIIAPPMVEYRIRLIEYSEAMKTLDLAISIILIPVDYLMIMFAGIVSYGLRYQGIVTQVRPVFFDVSFESFFKLLSLVALLGVLVFAWSGLYSINTRIQRIAEFRKVFFGVSTMLLIVVITVFFRREVFSSRFIILIGWVLAILFTYLARLCVYWIKGKILASSDLGYSVGVIGASPVSTEIQKYYDKHKQLGRKVVLRLDSLNLTDLQRLEEFHGQKALNELIVTTSDQTDIENAMNFCNDFQVTLKYLASYQQSQFINVNLLDVAGYPIIEIKKTPLEGWGRIVKRSLDMISSIIFIIIFSPLYLLIAGLIVLDSRGPVLVRLQRVGQGGNLFYLYKFRSMVDRAWELKPQIMPFNERADGPLFKMENDPRITRVGRWLRRTSLDELPQFWNVCIGNMSLVGPRPHEPAEVSQYVRPYRKLLTIKPGITGAAQISGRSKLKFEEEAQIDLLYIENWSIMKDLKIMLRTPAVVLKFDDAA